MAAVAPREEQDLKRSVGLAVLVGIGIGFTVVAVVFAIVAIPLFALARFAEPGRGLDRPLIRDNLLHVALPAGAVIGVLAGAIVGRWYRRGGHLPTE
jgi:hypothetical protein